MILYLNKVINVDATSLSIRKNRNGHLIIKITSDSMIKNYSLKRDSIINIISDDFDFYSNIRIKEIHFVDNKKKVVIFGEENI